MMIVFLSATQDIHSENDVQAGLSKEIKALLKTQETANKHLAEFIQKHKEKLGFKKDDIMPQKLSDAQVSKLDGTFDHSNSKKYYELAKKCDDADEAVLEIGTEAGEKKKQKSASDSFKIIPTFIVCVIIAHFAALY